MRISKPRRNCSSRNYPWWIFWDSTADETSVSGNSQPPNSARPITTPSKSTPTTRLKQASLIPTVHFLLFPKVITTHTPLYFNHEQGTFISCCLRTRRCRWVVYETEGIWWRRQRQWRQSKLIIGNDAWTETVDFIDPKGENDIKVHWHSR